jgi:type VI secretion system protein ImpG
MSDTLLPYYNRELAALRGLAGEFAEAHPKIASRLRLSADAVDDPHVARLLEGVAFLAARVHHRLDDEFPELTDALLGVLYPHYLAPVPSCAIAQFQGDPTLDSPLRLSPGIMLRTEAVRGEECRFRTAWSQTLWPIEIESVRLSGLPLNAPPNPRATGAASVLRITLRTRGDVDLTTLGLDRLRVFLRAPANVSLPLSELLSAHAVSVAYADGPTDAAPSILPPSAIVPVGFAPEEAILPWPPRSFSGFRLLTEYFAFPEKFLFLDFTGMEQKTLLKAGKRMDIFVYFDRALPELERVVGPDTLALGCTPIVNLFPQHCEPIPLTHTTTEYRIVPDARRPAAMEVWQVDRVRESAADGVSSPWRPFYRLSAMDGEPEAAGAAYHTTRRSSPTGGTEVFLAVADPGFDADRPADSVLSIEALCLNRDLPAALPFGGGHPVLTLVDGQSSVQRVSCISAPTFTQRPKLRDARFWRLVSHLSLSHLSIVDGPAGATALKEVLRLYDLRDSPESRAAIEGLLAVSAQPGTARVPGARAGAFCRGLDVTLTFDSTAWQSSGLFLLASVLNRFLALHATINSFVRTSVTLRGQSGRAAAWPARAGAQVLL